jgi:HK97 gp10 family phage protein
MKLKLDTKVLDEIIRQHPKESAGIVKKAALRVEALAKRDAPRDMKRPPKDLTQKVTGNLRNSIQAEQHTSPLDWWVHDGVEYGIYQEMGTSRMPARPFLGPAVESVRPWYRQQWPKLFKAGL